MASTMLRFDASEVIQVIAGQLFDLRTIVPIGTLPHPITSVSPRGTPRGAPLRKYLMSGQC